MLFMTLCHSNLQDTDNRSNIMFSFLAWNNIWAFIDHWTSTGMLQISAWSAREASHNDGRLAWQLQRRTAAICRDVNTLLLSRFSENSRSCSPPSPPPSCTLPALISPDAHRPQTVGTSPALRGCSPHLRDYSRLQTSIWCVGAKKLCFLLSLGLNQRIKNLVMCFFFFEGGPQTDGRFLWGAIWFRPIFAPHRWVVLEIAFPLLSPLGNL